GVQCWVAAGDVEMRRQSFTPRRATPAYFHLPSSNKEDDDLIADIREGLEEVFDHPDCRAPFIPGYKNKDDAVARAKLLRDHSRDGSDIILVRLRHPSYKIDYRLLENYAKPASYRGAGLHLSIDKVY
ncbi:hypothetical protein B0J13DRAFT_406622, partial [Dactylonectria estremocensis]